MNVKRVGLGYGSDRMERTDVIGQAGLVVGDRKEGRNDELKLSVVVCITKGLVKHSLRFRSWYIHRIFTVIISSISKSLNDCAHYDEKLKQKSTRLTMYILSKAATVWYLRAIVSPLRCIQKKPSTWSNTSRPPLCTILQTDCKQTANNSNITNRTQGPDHCS